MANKAAQIYTKIRTGRIFLILLSVFCVIWCGWNWVASPHWRFDNPGFPLLTLILSIEASLAASVIIMSTSENDLVQKQQLAMLVHQTEAIIELVKNQQDISAQIEKNSPSPSANIPFNTTDDNH